MKKQILLSSLVIALLGGVAFSFLKSDVPGKFLLEQEKSEGGKGLSKAQKAKEAAEWRMSKLVDETGNFYPSYAYDAIKQANLQLQSGSRAGSLGLLWEELGPDNVGGRTRAILIDKRDPTDNTIYAGGVSGGMWKSIDGANTWTRLSNWNNWMAVACIDQAPDGTIFIGTGVGLDQIVGSSFSSGSMGNGVFKLDANDNPVHITPDNFTSNTLDNNDTWAEVNRLAVNPFNSQDIIAATGNGLWRTTDGGTIWTQIAMPSGIASGGSASDVKWARDGINIFASVSNNLVMSPNAGGTWAKLATATNPGFPPRQGRIEIAIAPSDANTVYISIATVGGATYGVYKTSNASDPNSSWSVIGLKGPLFDPFGDNNQGWYDNTIAVSPGDPNKVYMGGVDFYSWSNQSGWKLCDAGLGAGNSNPNYIHPDKHTVVISTNNPEIMYVGCDGGVYKSVNAFSAFPYPNYVVKNRGYNVTQNYSVGAGISGDVLGGTQDNGTNYINYRGNTRMAAKMVRGGDGTYAEISHLNPKVMFAGIYFGENVRSANGGNSFDGIYDTKIDPNSFNQPSRCNGSENGGAQFISPFWLGETKNAANGLLTAEFKATDRKYLAGEVVTVESNAGGLPFQHTLASDVDSATSANVYDPIRSRFFVHSVCGVWVTPDALNLSNIPRWYKLVNSMLGTPVSLSSTADGDIVYVGTSSGRVYRFTDFNAHIDTAVYRAGDADSSVTRLYPVVPTPTIVSSSRSIEGVCVDPTNANHVVAVVAGYSNSSVPHVYESINGGATWAPLTNGLPNMPVYDVVVRDANTIIIGTELGVWSWDGSQWHEENNGLQRVPVYRMMEKPLYEDGCKVIYIGTHGRGMWRTTTLTSGGCNTTPGITGINSVMPESAQISNINIFPNPVSAASKISLTLDKSADITLRIFDITGKLYKETSFRNAVVGENLFSLDANGLPAGTYVLAATVDSRRTMSRLFTVAK